MYVSIWPSQYIHTYIHIYIYTYLYIHKYIHTYIYIEAYSPIQNIHFLINILINKVHIWQNVFRLRDLKCIEVFFLLRPVNTDMNLYLNFMYFTICMFEIYMCSYFFFPEYLFLYTCPVCVYVLCKSWLHIFTCLHFKKNSPIMQTSACSFLFHRYTYVKYTITYCCEVL